MRILAAVMAALLALPAAGQEVLRVAPVDEAPRDPDFVQYRDRLLDAVVARDMDTILELSHPEINLDFGGGAGLETLRANLTVDPDTLAEEYRHEAPRLRESYWAELEGTLRLGGAFGENGTEFVAPYLFTVDPPVDWDVFDIVWVVGEDVALRDRPIRWGTEVARLNYELVRVAEGGEGTPYVAVERADGTQGFVGAEYARPYLGYRAVFKRRQGKWRLVTFIAGD